MTAYFRRPALAERPGTAIAHSHPVLRTSRRLTTLAAGLALVLTGAVPVQGSDCLIVNFFKTDSATSKSRVEPAAFYWATSGVRHGTNLLVVDVFKKHLVELTEAGEFVATLSALRSLENGESVKLVEPSRIAPRREGGFLLLDDALAGPGHILAVTPDLFVEKRIRVEDRDLSADTRITAVFQFVELGDGALAFADFENPNAERGNPEKYWSRFVHLGFDGSHRYIGDLVPFELKDYLVRDFSPMAATGPNDAYVLNFDPEESWIAHVSLEDGTMKRLAAVPADFARAPRLARKPEWLGNRAKTDHQLYLFYKLFEESRMPVGLVTDDAGGLNLIAKGPMEDQRTPWWWVRISTDTGAAVSETRLPTHAAHILAPIVGGERVTVIEKGPVGLRDPKVYTTYRETDSMIVFPSKWLEGRGFQKLGGNVLFGCKPVSGKG